MLSLSIGELIYVAIKPLIKLVLSALAGAILARKGLLTPLAVRGASLLFLNLCLPCQLFSSVVSSITTANSPAIGPIFLAASFYQILGGLLGVVTEAVVTVPVSFRWGFLCAATFSNWGQLSLALVQSLYAGPPFNGAQDVQLGTSYLALFLLVNNLGFWALGGNKLIKFDYTMPAKRDLHEMLTDRLARIGSSLRRRRNPQTEDPSIALDELPVPALAESSVSVAAPSAEIKDEETESGQETPLPTVSPTLSTHNLSLDRSLKAPVVEKGWRSKAKWIGKLLWNSLTYPPTSSLLIALVIALIKPLKALFVNIDGYDFPTAPDGQPILSVILETASFLGAAAVPISLIVLGASMGTMRLPKPMSKLPWGAIFCLAIGKLVIMPIVGYFFVHALIRAGMIQSNDAVLIFLMILQSCMPSASNQVALTNLYAPDMSSSNVDLLCAHLCIQYPITAISQTILTAVTLNQLFN